MAYILYAKERQILEFIAQFIQRRGFAPTLGEIAEAVGVSAVSTIHEHLASLERKKFIIKKPGIERSIEITANSFRTSQTEGSVELPVLGFIAAGSPLEPYTDPNLYLQVSPTMVSPKKPAYILQVKGTSMVDEGILDGDYVVVQHQNEAQNGEIVVALLPNGLATLKRIFFEKDRIRLEPANSAMPPIFATHVRIQGKVVGVIRKYNTQAS
ncbi:transcriptional repressor LexA [Candidatus Gottesmanbacteria bacterium]|nr:transcriptional repressor LexA [Candidatus Gottesmanbacteria bacterium]